MRRRGMFIWFTAGLAALAAIEIFALAVMGSEPRLQVIDRNGERDWYVNTDTMVSTAPDTISYWNKIVPAKDSALFRRIADLLREAGKNPRRVEYVQTLQEADCGDGDARIMSVLFYDRKDRIVLSGAAPKEARELVALADRNGEVRRTVCDLSRRRDPAPEQE